MDIMDIKKIIKDLLSQHKDSDAYQYDVDQEGLTLYIPHALFKKAEKYEVNELLQQQHSTLKIMEEDGVAYSMPNGFVITSQIAVSMLDVEVELLQLPSRWHGGIHLKITGDAIQGYKDCQLSFTLPNGESLNFYTLDGPFIEFSKQKKYLLNSCLLAALQKHSKFIKDKTAGTVHGESNFYHLFSSFEIAKLNGSDISLGHFDNGFSIIPESEEGSGVTVSLELNEDGSGSLIPIISNSSAKAEEIEQRLGQLDFDKINQEQILRVGKQIILVNNKRLEAIKEIISNKRLSPKQVGEFQKNPTAFIDGNKVDLDNGYGLRVKGVAVYKQAYFGETDQSGIDWFGKALQQNLVLTVIDKFKDNPDILTEIEDLIINAEKSSVDFIDFDNETYQLGTDLDREHAKQKITENIERSKQEYDNPEDDTIEKTDGTEDQEKEDLILETDTNDEDLAFSKEIDTLISSVQFNDALDYSNYKRTPYSHQDHGIRWILGLLKKGCSGALLADDMGLGKTFTALAAIDQSKQLDILGNSNRPSIIVAPLSLLDNWRDEVSKIFNKSPFTDIIILNGTGLTQFKITKGTGREFSNQSSEVLDDMSKIRYALKIGNEFSDDERLDMPNRLIITTYQTVRDYQFSLCRVEWDFALFDEAQNIKNPNALQTRAAKALTSNFSLMITGTPVENSLADFWCIMDTAIPSEQLLGTYQEFRVKFITPIVKAKEKKAEIQLQVGRELRKVVKYFMLRRNKEDELDALPKKRLFGGIEDEYTGYLPMLSKTMEGLQLKSYEAVLQTVASSVKKSGVALAALHSLRNISLHPALSSSTQLRVGTSNSELEKTMFSSGKLESLIENLDEIKSRDEKVLIFVVNKQLQAFLKGALTKRYKFNNVIVINGDTKAIAKPNSKHKSRIELIDEFESKQGFNVIIMSPIAAGVGLNIVGANNVIHLERHWNPAKEAQATDRVYRIGQNRNVNVYYPILKHPTIDSFDVSLHTLLSNKTGLRDAVVTPEEVVPDSCIYSVSKEFSDGIVLPGELYQLTWQQFEALSVVWARGEYNTIDALMTKASNDHGADVVVLNNEGILIQCKQTGSEKYSKTDGIRELNSAPQFYAQEYGRSFSKKLFITNAMSVSSSVKKEAKLYDVSIVTGKILKLWLLKTKVSYRELEEIIQKGK